MTSTWRIESKFKNSTLDDEKINFRKQILELTELSCEQRSKNFEFMSKGRKLRDQLSGDDESLSIATRNVNNVCEFLDFPRLRGYSKDISIRKCCSLRDFFSNQIESFHNWQTRSTEWRKRMRNKRIKSLRGNWFMIFFSSFTKKKFCYPTTAAEQKRRVRWKCALDLKFLYWPLGAIRLPFSLSSLIFDPPSTSWNNFSEKFQLEDIW